MNSAARSIAPWAGSTEPIDCRGKSGNPPRLLRLADAIRRFTACGSSSARKQTFQEMIVSGGGTRNGAVLEMLARELAPLGIRTRFSDDYGLPSEAKEAAAFAVLAYETWHRRHSNVPSATGAKRGAVLGKISYP